MHERYAEICNKLLGCIIYFNFGTQDNANEHTRRSTHQAVSRMHAAISSNKVIQFTY
jgi:hypothetical protein